MIKALETELNPENKENREGVRLMCIENLLSKRCLAFNPKIH